MIYSSVYEIIFPDNSRYVGQSTNITNRLTQHKNNPSNGLLAEKIEKFGKDGFTCNIIEENINGALAHFIEKYEIAKTDESKSLNIHSKNMHPIALEMYKNSKEDFEKDYIKKTENIIESLKALIADLDRFNAMYKDDNYDNKKEVIKECEKLLDYLGLTVELKEEK